MNRLSPPLALAILSIASPLAGCSPQAVGGGERLDLSTDDSGGGPGGPDLVVADGPGGADSAGGDLAQPSFAPCTNGDPGCMNSAFGPPNRPFPLQSDPNPDPNEADNGVGRDAAGYIVLASSRTNFNFVWAANSADWNIGTVSKIDSKTVREVGRYFTVTCYSNPDGSRDQCDGTKGCCSRDDYQGFTNRGNGMPAGPHQAINLTMNSPSRTAVDWNGDMWVANRAFGFQSSVTKIANDEKDCVERNGTPGIQTSSDVNGDGIIDTDCNGDGMPDDVADVKAKPCSNGKPQEFYGLDDECVLFTTNTNVANQWGRPLALGRGSIDFGPSDAWAGTFQDGKFFRVDGASGLIKTQTQVPGTPYGAAIDASGILWAPQVGTNKLFYFDTANPPMVGTARTATFGTDSYGVSLDRDGNVWLGGYPSGNAYRYTPNRQNGFALLGQGYWTRIDNPGGAAGANDIGRGIAADSRTPQKYFVWMGRHPHFVVRIPASDIPVPMGKDVEIDGTNYLAVHVAGESPAGAGVDTDQNVWGLTSSNCAATRIKVDANGDITTPDIVNGQNGVGCPAGNGDRCPLQMTGKPDPGTYTYSDFTGFGLRNFTNPKGSYSYIVRGCAMGDTTWVRVQWDEELPPNTHITMHARSGMNPLVDNTWGGFTNDATLSPADLSAAPPLMPNPANYLQVEFQLTTTDRTVTPRLKSFEVDFSCNNIPG